MNVRSRRSASTVTAAIVVLVVALFVFQFALAFGEAAAPDLSSGVSFNISEAVLTPQTTEKRASETHKGLLKTGGAAVVVPFDAKSIFAAKREYIIASDNTICTPASAYIMSRGAPHAPPFSL